MNGLPPSFPAVLLLINIAAYFVGKLVGKAANFLARRELMRPRSSGIASLLALNAAVVAIAGGSLLRALGQTEPTGAAHDFHRVWMLGEAIGRLLAPGLLVLAAVAIAARLRRKGSAAQPGDDDGAGRRAVRSPGDRLATSLFWTVAIAVLVLLAAAFLAGKLRGAA